MTLRRWIASLGIVLLLAACWMWLTRGARERAQLTWPVDTADATREENASLAATLMPVAPVATDADGRAAVESSSATLRAAADAPALKPGEALVRIHATARETGRDLSGIDVQLAADGERARLLFPWDRKGSRGRTGDALVTDERGLAECIVSGDAPLWLTATFPLPGGWTEQELPPLAAGEVRVQEIALPSVLDARCRGRVVDAATQEPIPGASVALVDGPKVHTEAHGSFELVTASWRDDVARVEAPGYARNVFDLGPQCEVAQEPCLVPLLAIATLELRVSDARGAPAPGLRVRIQSPWVGQGGTGARFSALLDEQWTAETDDSGVCALELPPAEDLTLELLDAAGTTPMGKESLRLEAGEHRVLAMSVGDGSSVEGRVVDGEGRPLSDVDVFLLPDDARFDFTSYDERRIEDGHAFHAQSDAEGRFVFERVPSGTWWVGPGWKSHKDRKGGPAGLPVEVHVVEGAAVTPVTLTVWMGRCIRGRILAPDGSPFLPAQLVWCRVRATSATYSAEGYVSDDTFALGPLMPGSYRLVAQADARFADSEEVIARDGEYGVVLRMRDGGELAGVVVDGDGKGVPGLAVAALGSGRTEWAGTDDAGAFAFKPLEPGPYDLYASTEDGAASLRVTVERDVDRPGVVLRLEPVAYPLIRVKNGPRDLRCTVRVDGRWAGRRGLDDGGETRITTPPGALEIELFRRTQGEPVLLATRSLLAVAGEEPVVEFVLDQARTPK